MVTVILVITGALVTTLKNTRKTGETEIPGRIEITQITAMLIFAGIF